MALSTWKDADFELALKELSEPQIGDYEFFTESHDVKIWRLYNEVRTCTCRCSH